jgi:hypothetical protein
MPRKKKATDNELPPEILRKAMSLIGTKGGKAKGIKKARSSEQARAAVQVRWDKVRARKAAAQAAEIDKAGTEECPPTP